MQNPTKYFGFNEYQETTNYSGVNNNNNNFLKHLVWKPLLETFGCPGLHKTSNSRRTPRTLPGNAAGRRLRLCNGRKYDNVVNVRNFVLLVDSRKKKKKTWQLSLPSLEENARRIVCEDGSEVVRREKKIRSSPTKGAPTRA